MWFNFFLRCHGCDCQVEVPNAGIVYKSERDPRRSRPFGEYEEPYSVQPTMTAS